MLASIDQDAGKLLGDGQLGAYCSCGRAKLGRLTYICPSRLMPPKGKNGQLLKMQKVAHEAPSHWAFHPKIVARYFYSLTVSFPDATDVLPPPPHTWMKCLERLGARHED